MAVNYVKFKRGSFADFQKITKDQDTLYFITTESDDVELYLGEALISGSAKDDVGAKKLSDLSDVDLANLVDGNILVYDATASKWVVKAIADIIPETDLSAYSTTEEMNAAIAKAIEDIDFPETDLSAYSTTEQMNSAIADAIAKIVIPEIPEIVATGDDVVEVSAAGHTINVAHAKMGPEDITTVGAEADVEVNAFGTSAEIKVPSFTVDEYGHVNAAGEKTFKVSIPEAPVFTDTDTQYTLVYTDKKVTEGENEVTKKVIRLVDDKDAVISEIDASEFIKDGMLDDVAYDPDTNTLTFVWNTDGGIKTDTVTLTDLLDPYTAGAKIKIEGTEISHVEIAAPVEATAEAGTRKYITEVETDGYGHITGYKTATETVVDTNTTYTISAVDNKVTLTPSEGEAKTVTLDVYTKGQTDQAIADKINEVNGGESAGEVLASLNAYKKNIDTELWGAEKVTEWTSTDEEGKTVYNPDYTVTSRIDDLTTKLNALAIDDVAGLENALNGKIGKTDVNETQFEWINDKLNIKAVDSSAITGLEELLANKATVSAVSDLEAALNNYKETTDDRLDALEEAMTWGGLTD